MNFPYECLPEGNITHCCYWPVRSPSIKFLHSWNPSGNVSFMHPTKNDAPCGLEARFARNKIQYAYYRESKKNRWPEGHHVTHLHVVLGTTQVSIRLVSVQVRRLRQLVVPLRSFYASM